MNNASTDGRKRAAICREAAERVVSMSHACCCYALAEIKGGWDLHATFCNLFYGVDGQPGWLWGCITDYDDLSRTQRALALDFMAAMVEAGDA